MQRFIDVPFQKDTLNDDGTFTGYGSVFGGKADSYGDIIANGAFQKTLSEGGRNGTGVAMLWQHNSDQPIGVYTDIHEDSKGLSLSGKIAIDTQMGHDAHILMKMGAIQGLSIGWDFPKDEAGERDKNSYEINPKTKERTLKMINLWEISLVTFPAQTRARITGVKSLQDATNERELERAIRDLGLTKDQACYLTKLCKGGLSSSLEEQSNEFLDQICETVKCEADRLHLLDIMGALQGAKQQIKI